MPYIYIYIYMPIYIYTYIYICIYIYVHSMVSIRHVWYHFVNLHIQLFLWHQPETYLRSFEICLKEKQQDSSIFSTQRFIWTYITSTVSFMTCFHPFPLLNMTWMTSAFHRRSWINWVCVKPCCLPNPSATWGRGNGENHGRNWQRVFFCCNLWWTFA